MPASSRLPEGQQDAGKGRATGVPPVPDHGQDGRGTYVDRMLEILRKSPVLRLGGNKTLALKNIRPPAKTLSLSAEALVNGNGVAHSGGAAGSMEDLKSQISDSRGKPVALVFGPENGAISERLVQEAAKEAWLKSYTHLYVIGFAIQPNARQLIENCDAVVGIPATYIQATPDLLMGDLLKNMRSSQIFSVCGLPEIKVHRGGAEGLSRTDSPGGKSEIQDSRFKNEQKTNPAIGAESEIQDPRTPSGIVGTRRV